MLAATAASFTAEEAESVALVLRWAHTNVVDEPIGFEDYVDDPTPGAGTVYEMYADRQGSISAVVDTSSGEIVAEYSYDSFGHRLLFSGTFLQKYGCTGREDDPESGLPYFRARYFDPNDAKFISTDRTEFGSGQFNLSAYVENNPYNYSDPRGLRRNPVNVARVGLQAERLAMIANNTALMTGGALYAVSAGIANGPLQAIMDGFNIASAMMRGGSSDDAGEGDSPGPGPGNCGPNGPKPPNWKERFLKVLEVIAAVTNLQGNVVDNTPEIGDMPTSRLEARMTSEKWRDEMDELDDLYENAPDGSDDDGDC